MPNPSLASHTARLNSSFISLDYIFPILKGLVFMFFALVKAYFLVVLIKAWFNCLFVRAISFRDQDSINSTSRDRSDSRNCTNNRSNFLTRVSTSGRVFEHSIKNMLNNNVRAPRPSRTIGILHMKWLYNNICWIPPTQFGPSS
jgi:hypothetical protein